MDTPPRNKISMHSLLSHQKKNSLFIFIWRNKVRYIWTWRWANDEIMFGWSIPIVKVVIPFPFHKITKSKHLCEVIIPDSVARQGCLEAREMSLQPRTCLEQTICHCQYCKHTSWSCLLCSGHKVSTHRLYLGDNLASQLVRPVLFLLWLRAKLL